MLLVATLSCLVASAFLFPGSTACTAPSGRPGDCVLPADCPTSHGRHSLRACGTQQRQLRLCCEQPSQPRPPSLTVPVLPTDCGLGSTSDGVAFPNIAGRKDAKRSSWPWAALLGVYRRGSDDPQWLCGGVLLGPRHVLTAAHCVATMDRTLLVVRLGEHDLSLESSTRQERRVSRVVLHPNFKRSLADLALLVLDNPVRLSRGSVHPICLTRPDARLVGRGGYVVGWGQLGFQESYPDVLQEALVTVQETEPCEKRYQNTREYNSRFPGGWNGSVLCAADEQGSNMGACQGNGGGPLSVQRWPDGRYHLAGLVLEGIGCGNPDFPGLYTSVPHYVGWIRSEVQRP